MTPDSLDPTRLLPGPPNFIYDFGFLKSLTFKLQGRSEHRACVLVTGRYALEATPAVSLPTHKPLLIIYDPPGGMSYSTYEVRSFLISTDLVRLIVSDRDCSRM